MARLYILIAAMVLASASAHLCLLNPVQRGGVSGDDKAAAAVCAQTNHPCGDVHASPKFNTPVKPGEKITIEIMKNLDHFNHDLPGNFTLGFGVSVADHYKIFATIPDDARPSLSHYRFTTQVPASAPAGGYTIQAIYNTHANDAPAQFYQCGDVTVAKADAQPTMLRGSSGLEMPTLVRVASSADVVV